jgi:hypothetical protein
VRSAGLLRLVRGEARPFEQTFLQCGLPLGITARAGSRSALSGAATTVALAAHEAAAPTTGHVVTMSFGVFTGVRSP